MFVKTLGIHFVMYQVELSGHWYNKANMRSWPEMKTLLRGREGS